LKKQLTNFLRLKNEDGDKPPSKKMGYLIILGLSGILLIIISNIFSSGDRPEQSIQPENDTQQISLEAGKTTKDSTSDIAELEAELETELAEMLNKIQGVADTEVMVNLDATNEKVYEKNNIKGQQTTDESDTNGGTRQIEDQTEESQVVIIRKGDEEVPLLVQTKQPEVRGVFVVASGAEDPSLKNQIVEAVSRVLDVPTHQISVMPKN